VNATETGELLAFAALYDNRKVGDPDIVAWLEAIGDLPYPDARSAVAAHYGDSTERIMPGHVRTRVKAMRRERLERDPVAPPPAELTDDPGKYREALRAGVRRISDGFSVRRAIGRAPSGPPPPAAAEARKALGAALPPPDRTLPPQEIARRQAAESRAARGASATAEPEQGEPAA
jgi:hypothetical protein